MNLTYRRPPKLAGLALSVAGALGFSSAVESGTLTLATEPLGTATTSIKPNVMFLLDDSGSMYREYMPEYVVAPTPTLSGVGVLIPGTAACFDNGDTGDGETAGNIAGAINQCRPGDPPYNSPDFNTIYYNPAIFYRPAVSYDGTQLPSQDALNTTDWTRVRTDAYNVENWHQLVDANADAFFSAAEQTAANAIEVDLASGYPDRVWCTATGDAATGGNCRQNSAYTFPNYQFPYGTTDGTTPKYVNTAPYYYRMQTAQYCLPAGTDCRSGSAITTAHTLQVVEFCTDSELTDCAAGSAVTAAHTFSGVRWCSDAGTLQTCQRKKTGSFVHAKHLGTTRSDSGSFAAVPNEGQITVGSVNASGGTINSITIGGVTVFTGPLSIPSGSSTGNAATAIAAAISPHASFNATAFGSNVIVTQQTAGLRRYRREHRDQYEYRAFRRGEGHDHACHGERQHRAHDQFDHRRRHPAAVRAGNGAELRQRGQRHRAERPHRGVERLERPAGSRLGARCHGGAHHGVRRGRRLFRGPDYRSEQDRNPGTRCQPAADLTACCLTCPAHPEPVRHKTLIPASPSTRSREAPWDRRSPPR